MCLPYFYKLILHISILKYKSDRLVPFQYDNNKNIFYQFSIRLQGAKKVNWTLNKKDIFINKRFVYKNVFLVQGFLGDDDNILSVLTRVFLGEIPTSAEFRSLLYMQTT